MDDVVDLDDDRGWDFADLPGRPVPTELWMFSEPWQAQRREQRAACVEAHAARCRREAAERNVEAARQRVAARRAAHTVSAGLLQSSHKLIWPIGAEMALEVPLPPSGELARYACAAKDVAVAVTVHPLPFDACYWSVWRWQPGGWRRLSDHDQQREAYEAAEQVASAACRAARVGGSGT